MKQLLSLLKKIYPILLGAFGGYSYYYFIGCFSGSCPLTGNPFISTIYGAFIGSIFIFGKTKNKDTDK